ncbi:hypothetical protein WAI453_007523 [Rhynchosporium graminicola]
MIEFLKTTPKPKKNLVLALYFPILPLVTKGKFPVFIWFDRENSISTNKPTGAVERISCLADEENSNPSGKSFGICRNYVTEAYLSHTIVLYLRHAFRFDGSRMNVCNGGKIASGDRSWANEVAPYEDAETENASEDIVAQLLGGLSVTEAWAKRIG